MTQQTIWVVTEYYNDYDQHGGYFIAAYTTKEKAIQSVHHVGRVDYEYSWYEISEEELS